MGKRVYDEYEDSDFDSEKNFHSRKLGRRQRQEEQRRVNNEDLMAELANLVPDNIR